MVLAWVLALLVILGEEGQQPLTEEQAIALGHVLYRTIIPLDIAEAIRIVREVMEDPQRAMEDAT